MPTDESRTGAPLWNRIEHVALLVGLVGSATACLASYGWHWFSESLTFAGWSALPFGFLLLAHQIARRVVKSPLFGPVAALSAVLLSSLSLLAYVPAVLHPNHSSGMVFAIVPILSVFAICIWVPLVAIWFRLGSHPSTRR